MSSSENGPNKESNLALKRSRHFLTLKAAWSMYYAHIHLHIVHLCPIWTVAGRQRLRAVEVTQSRALRIVLNKPHDCSRSELYSDKLLPLRLEAQYETIFLMHRIVHNRIHHCLGRLRVGEIHGHQTRNASSFRIFNFRTRIGANSLLTKGLQMFNALHNTR